VTDVINEPRFKPCEIVRMVSTHPQKRKFRGKTAIVDEVHLGRRGRWRYKLMLVEEHFFEDELETTGEFD
jgi:hypothetical protein